jgi:hypothetical protein
MLTNYDPDSNIHALTDIEIYDAIRYLEPDPTNADEWHADGQDEDNGAVICVCLYILMLVCLGFLWFYWL